MFPFTVADTVWPQIARLIERRGNSGRFLRVGVKGGGCVGFEYVFRLDEGMREGDLVLEQDGVRIVCDPRSAEFLNGATLGWSDNLLSGGFTFENPNAARSCGCGTSFLPKNLSA